MVESWSLIPSLATGEMHDRINRTSSRGRSSFGKRPRRRRSSISPTKYRELAFPLTPKRRPSRPSSSGSCSTISSRQRSASSRLQSLATPRASSSWKKPINSKFSLVRSTSNQEDRNLRCKGTEWVKIGLDASHGGKDMLDHERPGKIGKTWKAQLSPKLQKILSGITPTMTTTNDADSRPKSGLMCSEYDCELWNIDVVSLDHCNSFNEAARNRSTSEESRVSDALSTPIIASLINHPFHLSCPPAPVVKFGVNVFQREITRLTDELESKDTYISELEAKVKKNDDRQGKSEFESWSDSMEDIRASSIAAQRSSRALSPKVLARRLSATSTSNNEVELEVAKGTRRLARDSIESFCTVQNGQVGELVTRLSGELDSKIEEMDQLRLDHEMEIDQIHCEIYKKNNLTPPMSPLKSGGKCLSQVKELASSLEILKRNYTDLRRSSMQSIQLAHNELDNNCGKIMSYVNEEVSSLREEEINAAHDKLQSELDAARRENARLEANMIQMQEGSRICERCIWDITTAGTSSTSATETPQRSNKQKRKSQPSPLPTLESWSQFCRRFRQALNENDSLPTTKMKLNQKGLIRADNLFRELSFHEIPRGKDEDSFVDACSSTDDNSIT